MGQRIDAHQHLWRYRQEEHGWITAEMSVLMRDFLPHDLGRELCAAGVDGSVVVQALQTIEETRWLLECAEIDPLIRGVVGWIPIIEGDVPMATAGLSGVAKLKGLRHLIQDEPDDGFILRDDFNAGIASMLGTGLVYDILIHERHLPYAVEFVQRHPRQVFVLDHLAKPKIASRCMEPWRKNLLRLASAENVACKLSGVVTEAEWAAWTLDDLRPYLDAALDAFGPERLMVGSDWPVCLLASGYGRWWSAIREWLKCVGPQQQDMILGETARRIYQLD